MTKETVPHRAKQEPPRCTKSAADGSYTLYVPPSSQIAVSYRKDDYFPEVGMSVTETTDENVNFGGLPNARAEFLPRASGLERVRSVCVRADEQGTGWTSRGNRRPLARIGLAAVLRR